MNALERAKKQELAARVTDALRNLETAVGGRDKLVAALQHAPESQELTLVIAVLGDPRNDNCSLGDICRDAGINVGQLWQAFSKASLAEAQVRSLAKVCESVEAVVSDVLNRSVEHEIVCEACYGIDPGKTARGKPKLCLRCGGSGFVKKKPDLKRQELVLEMGGLLKRNAGVNVNVQQTANTFVAGDAMAKFQKASDRILYGERERQAAPQTETVDAAPVDS